MTPPDVTQVLICGGGPTGLSLAVELGLRGIRCTVIEPRDEPTRLRPRAKTLNTRTLEHFRRWGLADRLRAAAPLPTAWSQDVSFCTTFLGEEITRFTGVLGLVDEGVSPELGQQMPQYELEALLREVVAELATVDLWLGSRVIGLEHDPDSATVRVQAADGSVSEVTADFVVGADGGRSIVRNRIGAEYVGTQALRPNTGVVFHSTELVQARRHAPAVQTWVLNHTTPGMMGPIDQHGLWWLIAFGVDGTSDDLDPTALVHGAIGRSLPAEIVSTDPWTARMELVNRARDGRVFLVGDAAHLNPPFGGHGLNTGIGDAVDLGWKIAATLDGWAGPSVLDAYEAERRPLHRRVIDEATANMSVLAPELMSPDLDRQDAAGERARAVAAGRIRETKNAEYFSLDLVLGHRYNSSPILHGSDIDPGPWASRAAVGRRLPHAWVTAGTSTLDLIGPHHTVLHRSDLDCAALRGAAPSAGLPVMFVAVEPALMSTLGAEIVVVRPDQVVAACSGSSLADADRLVATLVGRSTTAGTLPATP